VVGGDAVAGRGAAVAAAAIAAGCPLVSYYAQEARMYTLVALLSMVAAAAFVLAFVHGRRRHLVTLGAAIAALLYAHNWGLFLPAALAVAGWRCGARGAWAGATARWSPERSRCCTRRGCRAWSSRRCQPARRGRRGRPWPCSPCCSYPRRSPPAARGRRARRCWRW
jgi:hypothetical protein